MLFNVQHILELLGLSHAFDGVYGSSFMGDSCKPEVAAFEKVFSCVLKQHSHFMDCLQY
jgi:FMN phosphatase YigB (HAD superfamily)